MRDSTVGPESTPVPLTVKLKTVNGALLDDTTSFEFHFPDRGLTLAPDTFVDKAARIN